MEKTDREDAFDGGILLGLIIGIAVGLMVGFGLGLLIAGLH